MPPIIDLEKCTGCGICEECLGDVIHMREIGGKNIAYVRYPDECWHCGSCRQDCAADAISIVFPPQMIVI